MSFENPEIISAVVLDLDDLYVVTRLAKYPHHKAVAASFGFELTDEILDEYWGQGLKVELPNFYGFPGKVNDPEKFQELYAAFRATRSQYPKPLQPDTLFFHRAMQAAEKVLGVVTSLHTEDAKDDLEWAGLPLSDFDFVHGADVVPRIKPSGRAFEPALRHLGNLGLTTPEIVYLGDSETDYEAADEAGLQFIGVTTGRTTAEQFKKAGATVRPNLRAAAELILPELAAADVGAVMHTVEVNEPNRGIGLV